MPTKRTKRTRQVREVYPEGAIRLLETGDIGDSFDLFLIRKDRKKVTRMWKALKGEILPDWVKRHPGTRPWGFWRVEGKPRKRLGGTGTPCAECLAVVPAYTNGIPDYWISPFEAAFHRGEAVDCAGRLIVPENAGSGFAGEPIDRNDPPRYESQATYLDRLGLLLPGERKRIKAKDWELEIAQYDEDDGGKYA